MAGRISRPVVTQNGWTEAVKTGTCALLLAAVTVFAAGALVVTRVATYAALVTLYARTNRNALSSNPRGVTAWIDFGIKTWIVTTQPVPCGPV
jgi:hypothetical protein